MYKSIAVTARVMTMCLAATLGVNATNACADGLVANPTDSPLQYLVRFPDLDLSKIAGVTTLYSRLHAAALRVCEPWEGSQLSLVAQHKACMDKAINDAVATVDRPLLTQYHQHRSRSDRAGLAQLAKAQ